MQEGNLEKEHRTRLRDIQILSLLFQQAEYKINVTHWEYLVCLNVKDWPWTLTDHRKIGARFRDILFVIFGECNIEIATIIS